MKLNRAKLLGQLSTVDPGLSVRDTIEQSTCYVFRKNRVYTFNDHVACHTKCEFGEEFAVPSAPLKTLLSRLTEEEIELEVVGGELVVKGSHRKAGITIEAEIEMPLDDIEQPVDWEKLPEDFTEAVNLVYSCASKDQGSWSLTCVHIDPKFMETCDNNQAIRYPIELGVKESTLVPSDSLKGIVGLKMTEFSLSDNWIHFRNDDGLIYSCRRYMEDYSKLDGIFDVSGKSIELPKELGDALGRADIFSKDSDESDCVSISLKKGKLLLRGEGNHGWYQEMKKSTYDGDTLKFMVSPKLLSGVTSRSSTCQVCEKVLKVEAEKFEYVSCLEATESPEDED